MLRSFSSSAYRVPSKISRTISSAALVVPVDPKQLSSKTITNVDLVKLWSAVPKGPSAPKVGTTRIFYNTPAEKDGSVTALTSLGDSFSMRTGDARKEFVRKAIGSAVKKVKELGEGVSEVVVDASLDPQASAVAAHLAAYRFSLKTEGPAVYKPEAGNYPPERLAFRPLADSEEWAMGVVYARAQNFARTLMELPANILTPTAFTERVKSAFTGLKNVEVIVHDEAWAQEKGMNTFLSVTKGTDEPAKFLEIHYKGASPDSRPLAFVGKGITFDTGGISLKPSADMKLMRGDMGGAATVVGSALAVAQLQLPVNLVVVTPLCENLPGPSANKPGDVVYAMNGKSIEIDNTDAEGRLILADALYYASTVYKPHTLVDAATLTGAIDVALGEVYSGVFSTSDSLWEELRVAGEAEYDRFWRMPLDEDYAPQINASNADLCNVGGRPAGSCTAALFLKSFVEGIEGKDGKEPSLRWAHIDIAGSMEATMPTAYLEKGMTGRPVRALVEFVRRLSQ